MIKKDSPLLKMVVTGVFAAMITIMTAYICHIPYGANGGYIHFGDSLIYLAACILPTPYAMIAAAIGGGLADLLTAPMWAIPTIIIKMLISLPFTCKNSKIVNKRNVLCLIAAALISNVGYYIAEAVLFGNWIAPMASMPGSVIQATGSAITFLIIGVALDKVNFKSKVLKNPAI